MNYQIINALDDYLVENILSQMDILYLEQSHIPVKVLKYIAEKYEGFVNIALDKNKEQAGHIVYIPFNQQGYEKMISASVSEDQITIDDIYNPDLGHRHAFIFVYSIYSISSFLTKSLIRETLAPIDTIGANTISSSFIFAEIVSKRGELLANRMGLSKYHEYVYEGENITLFRSSIEKYLKSFIE